MNKFLVVRIAEGLGNQFFMYANSYSLSKFKNYKLYIDNESSYFKKKDFRDFQLNNFKISAETCSNNLKFNTLLKNLYRKYLIQLDKIKRNKTFLIEKRDKNKNTEYYNYFENFNFNNYFILEGHFESEKYFINYKNDLLKEFTFKNDNILKKNPFLKFVNKDNVVSICLRRNRFIERNPNNQIHINKSISFFKETIEYIKRAEKFIESKIDCPKYCIWSDDFSNLNEYFSEDKYLFINNTDNKILNDFYLMTQCKNFIVGPTTFHWWGAWLSNKDNKICVRPKNINPSNNKDFWPVSWIPI